MARRRTIPPLRQLAARAVTGIMGPLCVGVELARGSMFVVGNPFENFGDDVLSMILTELCTHKSAKSVHLEALAHDHVERIDWSLAGRVATDAVVKAVAVRCKSIRELSLRNCSQLSGGVICTWVCGLRTLTELDLGYCRVRDRDVAAMVPACPQLTALRVVGCSLVTDVSAVAIADACPKLTLLEATGTEISDVGVRAVLRGCPFLEFLALDGPLVGDGAFGPIGEECAVGPHRAGMCLHSLLLTNTAVTEHTLQLLALHHVPLTRIDLSGCSDVTNTAIQSLAAFPHLSCVGLASTGMRPPMFGHGMWQGLAYLTCVDLSFVKNITAATLLGLGAAPNLSTLHLSECTFVSVAPLPPTLCVLSVRGCVLSDLDITHLLENCCTLTEVDLSGVTAITDATLVDVIPKTSSTLRRLALANCNRVTMATVEVALEQCHVLESLVLSGCWEITRRDIEKYVDTLRDVVDIVYE